MNPSQLTRLSVNYDLLRGIEQNLNALYAETGDPGVRRGQESVLRALEQLREVNATKAA